MPVQTGPMIERTSLAELVANQGLADDAGDAAVERWSVDTGEHLRLDHRSDERNVLLVRRGRIELTLEERRQTLEAGEAIRFDGTDDLSPVAVEGSDVLLVASKAEMR